MRRNASCLIETAADTMTLIISQHLFLYTLRKVKRRLIGLKSLVFKTYKQTGEHQQVGSREIEREREKKSLGSYF